MHKCRHFPAKKTPFLKYNQAAKTLTFLQKQDVSPSTFFNIMQLNVADRQEILSKGLQSKLTKVIKSLEFRGKLKR